MLSVLVDGLAHVPPHQEFHARIYRRNAHPVAYLHRWVKAVRTEHPPADGFFLFSEVFDWAVKN